jgi:hypothetical protein
MWLRLSASFAALACLLLMENCTGAPIIGMDVSDYRDTFGTTGDEQLLISILRARDNAPLHFTELQTLGASIQLTSSLQATDPIGQLHGSTTRASLQGTLGAQNNPTFSLSTLETQSFTLGLMNPVRPTLIQQFLDEGIDRRLILLLFFSSIRYHGSTYLNNTKCETAEADCYLHFFQYLGAVDKIAENKITAHTYIELTPIGSSVKWADTTGVKDLAGIDPSKYSVEVGADGKTTFVYSVSEPKLALCFGRVSVLSGAYDETCTKSRVRVPVGAVRSEKPSNALAVRSVYQIIEYLGQILNFQEKTAHNNRCVTLGAAADRTCDGSNVLFQVNPVRGSPLVTTRYRGSFYTLAIGPCDTYCDHSAEVLKILNLLINANKSAADIPQVPLVHVQ